MMIAVLFCVALVLSSGADAEVKFNKKIKFEPFDTIPSARRDFPYEVEFSFAEKPVVGQQAILRMKVKATRDIGDTIVMKLHCEPPPYVELDTNEIMWIEPRKKKKTTFEIPVMFLLGGSYTIMFHHQLPYGKSYNLYQIHVAFGPDGKAIYFGKERSPLGICAGHFYASTLDTVWFSRRTRFEKHQRRMGIPFDIDLKIHPTPKMYESSTVDFRITTNIHFVNDIQFGWKFWPSLSVTETPSSIPGSPRPDDTFTGSFEIKPRMPGYGMINFRVFGRNIYSRMTGRSEAEIDLFMVFDTLGTLLYLGDKDITKCNFDEDNLLREFFGPVKDYLPARIQMISRRSQPDFEKLSKQKDVDSTITDQKTLDSLLNSLHQRNNESDPITPADSN